MSCSTGSTHIPASTDQTEQNSKQNQSLEEPPREVQPDFVEQEMPQPPATPTELPLDRVRAIANELLVEGDPSIWGRQGRLTPDELTNPFISEGLEGPEAFNVLDSDGYEGDYKCNLLAFEIAFRAGLVVPLMGRGRGWGYPGPNVIIHQIEAGRSIERWARRLEETNIGSIQDSISAGSTLMIVGQGISDNPGHMGLVDTIHQLERDTVGRIDHLEYSGWEANSEGGSYERRTWSLGRFSAIYLIELREPDQNENQIVPMGFGPLRASIHDHLRHFPENHLINETEMPINRPRGYPELPVAHSVLDERSQFGPVIDVRDIARGIQRSDTD